MCNKISLIGSLYTLQHFTSILVGRRTKVIQDDLGHFDRDQYTGLFEIQNYCHVNSKDRIVILVNTKEIIVNDIANDLPCKQIVAQR